MEFNNSKKFVIIPVDQYSLDPALVKDNQKEFISDFVCLVCHHLVIDPKMCKKCQKIFCSRCIQKTLKITSKCPQRCNYSDLALPRPMTNWLNSLKLRCPFMECKESEILYERMISHLNECEYMQRRAKCLGCKFIYPIKDIDTHASQCNKTKISCDYCKRLLIRKDFDEHISLCEDKIVLCPDCGIAFKRYNFKTHTKEECDKNYQIKHNYDVGLEVNKPYILNDIHPFNFFLDLKTEMHILVGKYKCMIQIFNLENELILAIGDDLSNIILYNVKDEKKYLLEGHYGAVLCLIQHEDILISGSYDKIIKIWDLNSLVCLKSLSEHTGGVTTLLVYNGFIISGSMDKTIRIWKLDEFSCTAIFQQHSSTISCIVPILNKPNTIASASYDKTIKIWDTTAKKCLGTIYGHTAEIESLLYINNIKFKNLIFSSAYDKLFVWDLTTYQCIKEINLNGIIYSILEFDLDNVLITISADNINLWNINDLKFEKIQTLNYKCKEILQISNLENKQLFAMRNDKKIEVYENIL
jgi:WD40 repeat protein